jgi:hypothetical protein
MANTPLAKHRIAAIVSAVLAVVYSGTAAWQAVDNGPEVGALEADLRPLARVLPRDGRVGYLEHATRPADPDVVRTFFVAQYALAPRVLVRNLEEEFLVVVRDHAAAGHDERLDNFVIFRHVRGGHRVFRRRQE